VQYCERQCHQIQLTIPKSSILFILFSPNPLFTLSARPRSLTSSPSLSSPLGCNEGCDLSCSIHLVDLSMWLHPQGSANESKGGEIYAYGWWRCTERSWNTGKQDLGLDNVTRCADKVRHPRSSSFKICVFLYTAWASRYGERDKAMIVQFGLPAGKSGLLQKSNRVKRLALQYSVMRHCSSFGGLIHDSNVVEDRYLPSGLQQPVAHPPALESAAKGE
jgi:hypothetical protein